MSLYKIDQEIRAFLDMLMDAVNEDGEIIDVDPSRLSELNAERNQKLENIACYIKNLESDAEAIKQEESNLKERRERLTNKANRLRKLLSDSILGNGDSEFSTAKCAVSFRKSTQAVIDDLSKIDKKFIKTKTTYDADKTAIKKAIKDGEKVVGAHIEEVQNIQIK